MFISIVMPAYNAQNTIAASVRSALAQTHMDFELIICADDQQDYRHLLRTNQIDDPRIKFTQTDGVGTGSSNARNVGMSIAGGRYIAVLDADDQFAPDKLEQIAVALAQHPLVTTGLEVVTQTGEHLRFVGCTGKDRLLSAQHYKRCNISMDSMVAHDRKLVPIKYDTDLPCLVDLGLILDAFCHVEHAFHITRPLHQYFKQTISISTGPEAGQRYVRIKKLLIERLQAGYYPLLGGEKAAQGMISFLNRSLLAEAQFKNAQQINPALIFEDHLESMLSH
ncbi:glycosyltransferase family 2 protein [Maritalea sp.]|uniref:glycosyltransferase family 2 protein n=1 Tax=Maritalea sp. TaxID=2003361 RepID=UPI003EF5329E